MDTIGQLTRRHYDVNEVQKDIEGGIKGVSARLIKQEYKGKKKSQEPSFIT
jgi:hypothetical protein